MFNKNSKSLLSWRGAACAAVTCLTLTIGVPTVAQAGPDAKAASATDFSAARRYHHRGGGGAAAAAAFAGVVGTIGAIAASQASRDAYYDDGGPYAYYGDGPYAGGPGYGGYGYYGRPGRYVDPGGNIVPR